MSKYHYYMETTFSRSRTYIIQGVPEKMSLNQIDTLLTKGHFFLDTWYSTMLGTFLKIWSPHCTKTHIIKILLSITWWLLRYASHDVEWHQPGLHKDGLQNTWLCVQSNQLISATAQLCHQHKFCLFQVNKLCSTCKNMFFLGEEYGFLQRQLDLHGEISVKVHFYKLKWGCLVSTSGP